MLAALGGLSAHLPLLLASLVYTPTLTLIPIMPAVPAGTRTREAYWVIRTLPGVALTLGVPAGCLYIFIYIISSLRYCRAAPLAGPC